MKPKITIDIVSDVVCPWCYIGKRRIEKAMMQVSDQFEFEVSYLPFELNPAIPSEGFNQKDYLTKKFGSEEKYNQITRHVTAIAADEGLLFDFEKQKVSPNTRDAHRILWYSKREGKQLAVKEAFMNAYFERGVDLTKRENLIEISEKAGLSPEKVSTMLNSGAGLVEVIQSEELNHQRGISGVPYYIINNQYGISGAQTTEFFVQAFSEISNQLTPAEGEA